MIGPLLCADAVPSFLNIFDFSIAPSLLFYAYIPILLVSLALSFYIYIKSERSRESLFLLLLAGAFSLWVLDTIILWTAAPAHIVMFWWQIIGVFEVLIFTFGIAFIWSFNNSSLKLSSLAPLVLPLFVVSLFLSTSLNVIGFDIDNCEGIIGVLWNLIYAFEIVSIFLIAGIGIYRYRASKKAGAPLTRLSYATTGMCIFLGTFAMTNMTGDFTKVYQIDLIGPVGMVIFFAYLSYIMLRFKTFGIKLFATQALVGLIWVAIGSLFFLQDVKTMHMVVVATFIALIPFGILLIRSVRKEIELRTQLEEANKRQQETLRFITHEVKGYLTDGAAAFDAILSNTFGSVNDDMRGMLNEAMVKNRNAIREIQNFLRIADFKTGKVNYARAQFDFKRDLESALHPIAEHATAKNLTFTSDIAPADYTMVGDADQLVNHVIGNLVNNSINYTQKGSVAVHVERKGDNVLFSVQDTGVGLTEEDKALLFTEGGHGKESRTVNPHSTGYGLFIAKQIVGAHQGRIWAESAGRGTGSTFFVELPTNLRPTLAPVTQK